MMDPGVKKLKIEKLIESLSPSCEELLTLSSLLRL